MKKILGTLCIIAILVNVFINFYYEDLDEDWAGQHGEGSEVIDYSEFTVTVPEIMAGDVANYDYSIFVEMYSENKSSGEWDKTTLTANGQLINKVPPVVQKKDGFYVDHTTYCIREETEASFTIVMASSDGDPFTINGNLGGSREEYSDLNVRKVIQTITNGYIHVDKIKRFPTDIDFDIKIRNYPDPNLPREDSLDERIFLNNQMHKLGNTGNFTMVPENEGAQEWLTQTYDWVVEGGEKVSGYNTLIINITTAFFQDFLPFKKKVWIANEVPFPVKVHVRTNTSAESENGSFYTIIEHTRTLQKNYGFTRGNKEIPWGSDVAHGIFLSRHPRGEFQSWEFMPKAGSAYDSSSFDFNPEDTVEFAIDNSKELRRFLTRYDDDVVVHWALYKAEKDKLDPQGKAGSYNWNISFGYKPTFDERIEARESDEYPHWGYYVNLTRNITKEPGIDKYSEYIQIINEGEYDYGQAELSKAELTDEVLTLASSEAILKLDTEIKDKLYDSLTGEIDFDNTHYFLGMGDITSANMPGVEIVELITGITLPSSKYSWIIQEGSVFETGSTFSAAVDVETGRLIYVTEIIGTELYRIFS